MGYTSEKEITANLSACDLNFQAGLAYFESYIIAFIYRKIKEICNQVPYH